LFVIAVLLLILLIIHWRGRQWNGTIRTATGRQWRAWH